MQSKEMIAFLPAEWVDWEEKEIAVKIQVFDRPVQNILYNQSENNEKIHRFELKSPYELITAKLIRQLDKTDFSDNEESKDNEEKPNNYFSQLAKKKGIKR